MTTVNPPRISESTPQPSGIAPGRKIFLAACIMLVGAIVAVIQLRDPSAFLEHGVFDSHLISAPLPSDVRLKDGTEHSDQLKPINEQRSRVKSGKTENVGSIPVLSQTPRVDGGAVKYAQAYPQPILIVDESVLDPSTDKKTDENSKPAEASKDVAGTPKPFISVNTEFKPIHQFEKLKPAQVKDMPADVSQPHEKPKGIENDELLTLFDFAENLGPISKNKTSDDMPENPFGSMNSVPGEAVGVSTVFDPDSTIILVPLEPLAPLEPANKTSNETAPVQSLPPLEPLRSDRSERQQHLGVTVKLTIQR